MADTWEDWEEEADTLVAGVNINEVDEDKFAGEDEGLTDDWESSTPAPQPKKTAPESKYAAKDREYARRAHGAIGDDPESIARAQEEAELAAAQELFGGDAGPRLETMAPKSNADFEEYARALVDRHVLVHAKAKQYKFFVKQLARAICEPLDKDEVKDVETAVASVRSAKVKAEREAAAAAKKGPKKSIKMESNDISAGLDDLNYKNMGDDDDEFDFM